MSIHDIYPNKPAELRGEAGAARLAARIEAHWQARGVKVQARVEKIGHAKSAGGEAFAVRSTLKLSAVSR